jgi:5-methylcytosine-specific restriction endonuclease McrA
MKRLSIPMALRKAVWSKWNGIQNGIAECYTGCGTMIDSFSWQAGHVISKKQGGEDCVDNLRPVCSTCNQSMGTENMKLFSNKYFFKSSRFNNEDCYVKHFIYK